MIWYVEIFLTVPRIPRKVCVDIGGGGGGRVSDVEISGEFNMEVIGILTGPEKTCRHSEMGSRWREVEIAGVNCRYKLAI